VDSNVRFLLEKVITESSDVTLNDEHISRYLNWIQSPFCLAESQNSLCKDSAVLKRTHWDIFAAQHKHQWLHVSTESMSYDNVLHQFDTKTGQFHLLVQLHWIMSITNMLIKSRSYTVACFTCIGLENGEINISGAAFETQIYLQVPACLHLSKWIHSFRCWCSSNKPLPVFIHESKSNHAWTSILVI
jgi:hypothetical protein